MMRLGSVPILRAPDPRPGDEDMTHPLLPVDYRPSENEPFMNPVMREYFRQKLLKWRSELLHDSSETLVHLQTETVPEADITDREARRAYVEEQLVSLDARRMPRYQQADYAVTISFATAGTCAQFIKSLLVSQQVAQNA